MKTKLLIVALSLFLVDSLKAQYTMLRETWRSERTETNSTEVWSVDMKTSGGNIYQLGKLNNGSNTDVVIAKISNAGVVLWQQVYNSSAEDTPVSIGVDNAGNSYAIMTSVVSGTNRIRVVKYNTSGIQQWVWTQTGGVLGSIAVNGTTDASGNTYVIGTIGTNNVINTYKISNAGTETWSAGYSPNGFTRNGKMVAVDASSNVYVCGWQNTTANGVDWVTIKYNSTGTQQWEQSYGGTGNDTAKTILIDGANNVIVGGKYNSNEAHVRKYTAAGATSWTNIVDLSIDDNSSVVLQYDNSNNIYAAACRNIYSSSKKQTHLKKISSTGIGLWDQYYSGTSVPLGQPNQTFENYPKQILVHNDSNYVYVGIDGTSKNNAGFVSRGFHIARFRTTNGNYNPSFDNVSHNFSYPDVAYTNTIAFADNNQSIIITGSHKYTTTSYKIRTVKYNNYIPIVKAHEPSFNWSTNNSVLYMCDLGAKNVRDSIRLEPSGLQAGYTYFWVCTAPTNEDFGTEYFSDRTNPNSFYNPPIGIYSNSYRLKITDSNNNEFYSLPVTITRRGFDKTVTLSGPPNICSGGSVELSMPQIGTSHGLSLIYKKGTPNQTLQTYAGVLASSSDSLIYSATTPGQYFFEVDQTLNTPYGYSGYSYYAASVSCYHFSDTITIDDATPTITGTTPNSRCGTGTVTLGATASAGTLSWYAAATGGASLGTGTSFVTPSISSTTTYYVETSNGGCTSPRTAVTATVNTTPTITGTTPNSRCGTGTVTLGATASAGTLSWYAAATGGASLGTGTSFVTPSISSTTTYYVETSNGGCTSPRTAVTATVNTTPTVTVNQTGNTLTVQEGGLSYQWVDCNNSNAAIPGETGQSFNVSLNGNYAVEVTENGCVTTSNCTNVIVTNIEAILIKNEFKIYPNPTTGKQISIHSTQGIEQVRVYDAIGKMGYSKIFNNEKQLNISLQNFEKGIYFIQINKTTQKLIIE